MRVCSGWRLLGFVLLVALTACGGGGGSTPPLPGPSLAGFSSSSLFVDDGQTFQLTATYTGTSAVLSPGAVAVTSGSPLTLGPITRPTLFTLTVTGANGTTLRSELVVALSRPAANRVVGGTYHSLALKPDGSVWAWGSNSDGQLGDGTNLDRSIPVQVKGVGGSGTLGNVALVAATYYQSFAVLRDGMLYGWGWGANGELGQGTHASTNAPVKAIMENVVGLAAGGHHTVALRKDGTVWTWGNNTNLQLGYPTMPVGEQLSPKQVPGLTGVVSVAAGFYHSLALKADGTVWAFGQNLYGELGNNTTNTSTSPVQVLGSGGTGTLSGIVALAAGASQNWTFSDPLDYCAHSLALSASGQVYAWGNNAWGQLGIGTTAHSSVPTLVSSLTGVSAISAAYGHSMAIANGGLFSWGRNGRGSLGDASTTDRSLPVQVVGSASGFLSGVVALGLGADAGHYVDNTPFDRAHGLAITSDGSVYAWGCNYSGELGQGTANDHSPNPRPLPIASLVGF